MQIKYKVKKSTIAGAGLGLFANEFIPKGTVVWKYLKENHQYFYSKQSLEDKTSLMSFKEAQTYLKHCIDVDANTVIHFNDDSKYGNHSSNDFNIGDCDKDLGFDVMCATRDIDKGQEILENYLAGHYYKCKWMLQLFAKYNVWTACPKSSKL